MEFEGYVDELLESTERRTVVTFAHFPAGTLTAERYTDGDGITDQPIKLAAAVRIAGGRVTVDLIGCSVQRPSPTNATSSQTYAGVVYVLKCSIDPVIPMNDGFYRLVTTRTRPGTVVHAQHPARVAAGWEVAIQLCALLFKALVETLPDRMLTGTKGCICNIAFSGINPHTSEYFTFYETVAGSYGATHRNDGMNVMQAPFQTTENAPVEGTEVNYPVCILRYELIPDSEGAGRHRGGLGVQRDCTFPGHTPSFSGLSDKAKYPHPSGVCRCLPIDFGRGLPRVLRVLARQHHGCQGRCDAAGVALSGCPGHAPARPWHRPVVLGHAVERQRHEPAVRQTETGLHGGSWPRGRRHAR